MHYNNRYVAGHVDSNPVGTLYRQIVRNPICMMLSIIPSGLMYILVSNWVNWRWQQVEDNCSEDHTSKK